ncbi:hypothetical protein JTB14_015164 [Gonioctena quinquepunctata]|nr:hypothetical protein JTB14_015164 [Gonioctena quinquepunctata]
MIDGHSRYSLAEVVLSTKFRDLKQILEKTLFAFGILKSIKSDNGPPFNGHEFSELLCEYGIKHVKDTPHWPEANSMAGRFFKTFKKSLKCAPLETVFKKIKANGANSSRSSDYPPKSFGKIYITYQEGNHPHTLEIEEVEVPSDDQFPNKPVCTAEIEKTSRSRPLRQMSRPKHLEDFECNGDRRI